MYFDTATQTLEIDQNPAGERSLVPVTHAGFSDDFRTMQLEAVYRGEPESFEVTSTYDSDQVMHRLTHRLLQGGHALPPDAHDVIEVNLQQGAITLLNVIRSVDGKVEKSIRITRKDGQLFLVIPSPWQRVELLSAGVDGQRIVCRSPDGEIDYELATAPFVAETLSELLEAGLPD
ncbi:hypothetical protein EER27_04260 [Lysobacter psychrotolerans]|uniref:Uncharacterized protein n=1 Tax=Montanilutibacter psychrotolerans TaxID=1327343 RepID=A0A3M8T1M2_9GAMM|nr:hypothetical protein EER27_04260 [Lysobacter psychrotolerans]